MTARVFDSPSRTFAHRDYRGRSGSLFMLCDLAAVPADIDRVAAVLEQTDGAAINAAADRHVETIEQRVKMMRAVRDVVDDIVAS